MRYSRFGAVLAFGLGLLAVTAGASGGRPPEEPGEKLRALLKERVEVLEARVEQAKKEAAAGGARRTEDVRIQEERLAVARAELAGKSGELKKLLTARVAELREKEEKAQKAQKAGAGSVSEELDARAARLEAEIALARVK